METKWKSSNRRALNGVENCLFRIAKKTFKYKLFLEFEIVFTTEGRPARSVVFSYFRLHTLADGSGKIPLESCLS